MYFTQGHGEKDTDVGRARRLQRDRRRAEARELHGRDARPRAAGAVPDDATVVVVAGPRIDFFPPEIDALKKYLAKGGKLLLMLDPPDKADSPPLTNLIALAHDWGIDVGNDVVVDVSGMGRLIGTDASVPVAASYPPHPITERFNVMTAYPLARSVTPVSGGVNGHTAQPFVETSPRSWAETDIKACWPAAEVALDEAKGDKQGPIVARPRRCRPPVAPAPATPPKPGRRRAEAGDPGRGDRRLRLRLQRRARHPGQPRPVHEHGRLAVAAGEPDLDPAEGSRRPADHADRDAAEQHHLAVAAARSRLHLRHGHLQLVAEAIDARPAIDDRARSSSWSASARTSISSPGKRRRMATRTPRSREGLRRLEADKIDEIKVKSEAGDVTTLKKEGGAWQTVAADCSEGRRVGGDGHHERARPARDRRASSTRTRRTSRTTGSRRRASKSNFKTAGGKDFQKLSIGDKTPTGADLYARRNDEKRVFLIPAFQETSLNRTTFDLRDKVVIKFDREKVDGVDITAGGKTLTLAKDGGEWKITKPVAPGPISARSKASSAGCRRRR